MRHDFSVFIFECRCGLDRVKKRKNGLTLGVLI